MNLALAQVSQPCVDVNMSLDFSCSCIKSNSCYKSMSSNDKKVYKAKVKTSFDKKLFNLVRGAYSLEDEFFSGKVSLNSKEFKKLDKISNKLNKYNANGRLKLEKFLKKKGVKAWKIADRKKAVGKTWSALITKERWKEIEENGVGVSLASIMAKNLGGNTIDLINLPSSDSDPKSLIEINLNQIKGEIAGNSNDTNSIIDSNDSLISGKDDISKAAINAKELIKTKSYNLNDIHAQHINIWKTISNRYTLLRGRLDQTAILIGSKTIDMNKTKKNLSDLINMM